MLHKTNKNESENVEKGRRIAGQVLQTLRNGQIESDAIDELRKFAAENPFAYDFFRRMSDTEYLKIALENYHREDKKQNVEQLFKKIEARRKRRTRVRLWYEISSVAAVIAVAVLFLFRQNSFPDGKTSVVSSAQDMPAVVLESGETIVLANSGPKITIGDVTVEHAEKDKIVYTSTGADSSVPEYHTLIVPKKSIYTVGLSDGTEVKLNAGSKLTYPVRFTGEHREVQLEGEACFDVSKQDSQPFIVTTGNVSVKVLGTLFNIEAYPEMPVITTLVRGSIEVSNGEKTQLVKPNQQIIISPGQFDIKNVPAHHFIEWANSMFYFTKTPLHVIMSRLARWYEVEVVYATSSARDIRFTMEIKRYDNISDILSKLEKSGCVRFKKDGKKIVVEELK
jgi:ferric-dicitrate binding protein FerR (iron transport regulator)